MFLPTLSKDFARSSVSRHPSNGFDTPAVVPRIHASTSIPSTSQRQLHLPTRLKSIYAASCTEIDGESTRRWPNRISLRTSSKRKSFAISAAVGAFAQPEQVAAGRAKILGGAALLTAAFFWATYSPLHRYLYSLPGAPTPSVVTATRTLIASGILLAWSAIRSGARGGSKAERAISRSVGSSPRHQSNRSKNFLTWSSGSLLLAGCELAMWNTLAAASQAVGLMSTSALRATFLMTSGKVFTCIMALLAGNRLSRLGWAGCIIAALGSLGVTFASSLGGGIGNVVQPTLMGEGFVVTAAFFFSLILVRVGTLSQTHSSVDLAMSKTLFMTLMAMVWVAVDCVGLISRGDSIASLWLGISDWRGWAAVSCVAIGPGVLADILLNKGQQFVSTLQAQIYLNTSPFWAGIIASQFLKETTSSLVWLAGIVTIFGGVLASV